MVVVEVYVEVWRHVCLVMMGTIPPARGSEESYPPWSSTTRWRQHFPGLVIYSMGPSCIPLILFTPLHFPYDVPGEGNSTCGNA